MKYLKSTVMAGLFCAMCASAAWSQTAVVSSTGLGQAWPNATDVSTSPNWHVYVFYLNGIKYVQVNDLNGTVHAAVGSANGTAIVLPVGVDAQNVQTTTASATNASSGASASASTSTVVYSDSTTTVTATPQSSGNGMQFKALVICNDGFHCQGGNSP